MLNLSSVNESFTMDELDNWTTTVGLVQSILKFVEKEIPSCSAHLFFHSAEFHEYREIDREGITSFSDDSIFIGCLSMVTELIPLDKMFGEFQIDDPMISEVMRTLYNGRYLVPIVHGFDMLAFLLISAKDASSEEDILTDANKDMLNRLSAKIQINLYAASVATRGQKDLLRIAEYPFVLQKHEDLNAVNTSLFNDLKKEISFNKGVAYRYIEAAHSLSPFAYYKIDEDKVPNLRVGEGISGQVFQSWKSIFVPDRKGHPAYSMMKEESFLDDSIISVPFGTNQERLGVITISRRKNNKETFSLEHQYMMEIAASFFAVETINRKLYQKLENNEMRFVKGLTHTLEEKDKYTQGHSDRVAKYSVAIGKRMGYDATRLKLLNYGAQLHDIGKIGISDDIINKPDKLSDEEFKTIKNHTDLGYNILAANPYFDKVKDFVLYHHETLDGKGYHHIKGEEIPEEAMVISCADIYDALTSDRSYRKALERKQALQILATNIGVHFTKEIYNAFEQYLENDAPTEA